MHVDTTTHRGAASDEQLRHPQPPRHEIGELVARYLGPVRRAGQGTLPGGEPSGEGEIMVATGFAGPRRRVLDARRVLERTEDEIVASVFSVTSSAPHLFGDRVARFERDLRRLLQRAWPEGRFCEVTAPIELIVWTRPAEGLR